jgi:hypothetical protein
MEDVLHAMAEPVFNSSLNRGGLNTCATMQNSKIATVISAKLLSIREGVMAPTSPPVSVTDYTGGEGVVDFARLLKNLTTHHEVLRLLVIRLSVILAK